MSHGTFFKISVGIFSKTVFRWIPLFTAITHVGGIVIFGKRPTVVMCERFGIYNIIPSEVMISFPLLMFFNLAWYV